MTRYSMAHLRQIFQNSHFLATLVVATFFFSLAPMPTYAQDTGVNGPVDDGLADEFEGTDDSIAEEPTISEPEVSTPTDRENYGSFEYGGDAGGVFSARRISAEATYLITRRIENANGFCDSLGEEYAIDCLADQYEQLAETLPKRGDYAPLKTALISAAEELHALALANQDPILPVARPKSKAKAPKASVKRALVPVSKKKIAKVRKAATKVIAETQTVLLRSAENSRRRKLPYTKIAAAIGSNKVLLRSA